MHIHVYVYLVKPMCAHLNIHTHIKLPFLCIVRGTLSMLKWNYTLHIWYLMASISQQKRRPRLEQTRETSKSSLADCEGSERQQLNMIEGHQETTQGDTFQKREINHQQMVLLN